MFCTQPIPDLQSSKGDKSCIKIKIKCWKTRIKNYKNSRSSE